MKQDRITIRGPEKDGSYIVEFKIADREALALRAKGRDCRLNAFKQRCPMGSQCRMSRARPKWGVAGIPSRGKPVTFSRARLVSSPPQSPPELTGERTREPLGSPPGGFFIRLLQPRS